MSANSYDPLFKRLCYCDASFSEWTHRNMLKLTSAQLAWMCRLLGAPHSGTKDVQIARLLDTLDVRRELSTWGETSGLDSNEGVAQRQAIAARHKLVALRALAKRAGTYRWISKYGVVCGLLAWRSDCRRKGIQAQREMREQLWTPQLEMPFEPVEIPSGIKPLTSTVIFCDIGGQSIHGAAETVAEWFEAVFCYLPNGMKAQEQEPFRHALTAAIEAQWRGINARNLSSWPEDVPPVPLTCWPRPGFLVASALEAAGAKRLRGRKVGFIALDILPWKIEVRGEGI